MAGGLWEVFRSIFTRNTGESDEDDEQESEGFIPSPLDLSVRYSHGGPDDEIEREFQRIHEQARELEDKQREE